MSKLGRLALCGVGLLTVGSAGCVPPSQPFAIAETEEVLKAGQVRVSAGGGVAEFDPNVKDDKGNHYWGGGVGARVRVGIGHRSEIGAEGTVLWGHPDSTPYQLQGRVAWKYALAVDWLALVVGAGGGTALHDLDRSLANSTLGLDAALILGHRFAFVTPYVGARAGFAESLGGGVPLAGFDFAAGVALDLLGPVQLLVEAGVPYYVSTDSNGSVNHDYGVYGLAAIGLKL